MDIQSASPDRIVRPSEAAAILSISKATLLRMRRRGDIPEPIRVSRGVVGWRQTTLQEWLDQREAEIRHRRTLLLTNSETPSTSQPGKEQR